MTISGRARVTGIFGDPVEHSLSPAMHNAAYAALKSDRVYVPFRVSPADLRAAIRAIPSFGFLGVNLTVPHKEQAAGILRNSLSAEARQLGAVNCIINSNGRLRGDNTDARGLEIALREHKLRLGARPVLIIGAGGGAAAAIVACRRLGARRLIVANRTVRRAHSLARRLGGLGIEVRGLDALVDVGTLCDAALIINATSAGLDKAKFPRLDYKRTAPDCFFHDLIYAAKPTPFLSPAVEIGRRTADGATMLLYQGALAFKLFNRIAPPVSVMRSALMKVLGR